MRKIQNAIMTLVLLLSLAACGSSKADRALSGADAGAANSAVTGGDPARGAVTGGAVGAAAGAVTKKKLVFFGKPMWR